MKLKEILKKNKFYVGFILGIVLTIILYNILFYLRDDEITSFLTPKEISKLNSINNLLDEEYIDNIPHKDKVSAIYKGLLDSAGDRYTEYYTKKEYEDLRTTLEGDYCGIGAVLKNDKENNGYEIVEVYKDSGAYKAGLKMGDILVSVDGKKISDYTNMDYFVSNYIRGKKGQIRVINYLRNNVNHTVKIKLNKITIPSVKYKMIGKNTGYVRIYQFSNGTEKEFMEAINYFKKKKIDSIIYDLRDNGGGMVDSVVNILDDILPKGKVLTIKDKNGKTENYYSDDKKVFKVKSVVLVNSNTASSSEIFTGALRDFKWATIVGEKTFGKGIVQVTHSLPDGSAIKLTNAKYYTPSGESIHKKGIKPDVLIPLKEDKIDNDKNYDNQIKKAISILENKK